VKELILGIINVECFNCKTKYKEYKMSDFVYGERIFETEKSHFYAYCNCIEDETFNEIIEMVDNILKDRKYSKNELSDKFNKIFGYICDQINDERIVDDDIFFMMKCKECGSNNIKISNKEQIIEVEKVLLPEITYNEWNKVNKKQKIKKITELLKNQGE
jgi:hypothetical protein